MGRLRQRERVVKYITRCCALAMWFGVVWCGVVWCMLYRCDCCRVHMYCLHKLFALKSLDAVFYIILWIFLFQLSLTMAYVWNQMSNARATRIYLFDTDENCDYAWWIRHGFIVVNNLQFNSLGISILLDFRPDNRFDATLSFSRTLTHMQYLIYTLPLKLFKIHRHLLSLSLCVCVCGFFPSIFLLCTTNTLIQLYFHAYTFGVQNKQEHWLRHTCAT